MKRIIYAIAALATTAGLFSCGDTDNIGSSILQDEVKIIIDSSFTATGSSVLYNSVQSKTTTQLLGRIEAPEYGRFASEFVTQFMPSGAIDTTGVLVENIDSLKLIMAVPNGALVGDSIVPMGLNIYMLDKQLPSPIYSNFDPEGYYDPSQLVASEIYAPNAMNENDTIQAQNFRFIYANMPVELGRKLFQAYLDNPASYLSPSEFTKIFPGIYVANSFGSGRVVRIQSSIMRMYYHIDAVSSSTGNDTTLYGYGNYYAVTPEIVTNNDISYEMSPTLAAMINAGKTIVSAPTGSDVQFTFPAQDVVNSYRKGSGSISMVNSLTMSIPAEEIANDYGINPPENLLMVLTNKKDDFFLENSLPDNETSFYATYDSAKKCYSFSNMRDYMLWLLQKDTLTPDDYTFTLTPVSLNMGTNNSGYYGSSSYLESVAPYVYEPAMADINIKNSKIILTYSRQSAKN